MVHPNFKHLHYHSFMPFLLDSQTILIPSSRTTTIPKYMDIQHTPYLLVILVSVSYTHLDVYKRQSMYEVSVGLHKKAMVTKTMKYTNVGQKSVMKNLDLQFFSIISMVFMPM